MNIKSKGRPYQAIAVFYLTCLLAACAAPAAATPTLQPATVTVTMSASLTSVEPQATTPVSKVIWPTALATQRAADALASIIYASDPTASNYDPHSALYAQFPQAVQQIADLGSQGINESDALAVAIAYPRADAYLAAQALLTLGSAYIATDLGILLDDMKSSLPQARANALILSAAVGKDASFGVGVMAPLLWDTDAGVRTAAAIALEKITNQSFVPTEAEITLTPAFVVTDLKPDTPEGQITGKARTWWNTQGTQVVWHPNYDLCDP